MLFRSGYFSNRGGNDCHSKYGKGTMNDGVLLEIGNWGAMVVGA